MENNKKKFRVLAGIFVFIVLIITCVLTYTANIRYFGIRAVRKDGYSYSVNEKIIWDIIEYSDTNGTVKTNNNGLYCVKAEKGFASGEDGNKPVNERIKSYDTEYKMRSQASNAMTAIGISEDNYKKLMWLLDTMYIRGNNSTSEDMKQLLDEAMKRNDEEGTYRTSDELNINDHLTDYEVETVQQLAIWYYTNHDDINYNQEELAEVLRVYSSDPDAVASSLIHEQMDEDKMESMQILYKYLIYASNLNGSAYDGTYTLKEPVTIAVGNAKIEQTADSTILGPYTSIENNKLPRKITAVVTGANDSNINEYKILNENKEEINEIPSNGIFYISIGSVEKEVKITFNVQYKTANGEPTLITDAGLKEQPLVEVDKTIIDKQFKSEFIIKDFDLALRKYITKVTTDGETVTLENASSRVPDIDTEALQSETTATYNHKKDPVVVKTGSVVTYNITVYNEGEADGRATKIVDQLPTGLKFNKVNTQGYTADYDEENNIVTFTKTGTNNLAGYNGQNLASETIEIECEVTAQEGETNQILTNVAWISEAFNEETDETITNQVGADRDSEPSTRPEVNKDNMTNYKGNQANQDDLTHSDYFYKGEQDDDDFEKLVILPREHNFDIALRKYITKVTTDGETVTLENESSRVPDIDTSTLQTGTTATYDHKKDPVVVKTGSIVTYNITIYNEGEAAGRATKIVDQLPTGLRFSKVNTAGYTPEYNEANNTLTLTKTETNNLAGYDGQNLASETIEIECEVVQQADQKNNIVLTNVAWISEAYNAEKDQTITSEVGADRDSTPAESPDVNKDNMSDYKGNEANQDDLTDSDYFYRGQEDDDDFEKLVILPQSFDLKLVKYITEVNGVEVDNRIENVDVSKLNTLDESGNLITTGEYTLNKEPVVVKKGDFVKYTFRIYNEGSIDGYASRITEDIPEGLEFLWSDKYGEDLENDETLTEQEKEAIKFNQSMYWTFDEGSNLQTISTDYLSKDREIDGENLIKAFDQEKGYIDTETEKNPDYKEVSVILRVTAQDGTNEIIRNEAAITEDEDADGNEVDDRDSDTDEWVKYEDDEDYDNIILQSFDLALRKFIAAVSSDDVIQNEDYLKNEDGSYTRAPQVDTSLLNTIGEDGMMITTATYNHPKTPVTVKRGDYIIYILRVYNEGSVDGYAGEIKDHLPSYLEFVDDEYNETYGWTVSEDGRTVTTRYLEDQKIDKMVEENGEKILSYKEVPIKCRVKDTAIAGEAITNIADITEYKNEKGEEVDNDRDSVPDNVVLPDDEDLPGYKDDEQGPYVPGQEDDDDFEKVIIQRFDLALRKFITAVDENPVTNRIPEVSYENGEIVYTHTKEPVDVVSGNIVTYTIRVYNEGDLAGYAKEISDDIPDGLEFLPEHQTNLTYRWVMYDSEGNVTTDVNNAEKISTDYLSKEQEQVEGENLLRPFDSSKEISTVDPLNPDYRDVQVAFRVVEPNSSDKIIINSAQISDDSDENGEDIDDDDSTPDEWNEGEDDQDKEYIKLNEFDLALKKWVSKTIVIENGKETITPTGHTGDEDPEPVVKVELDRKNLDEVVVKFGYMIKVTNEGDIAGYVREITDYVPEGLRFVAEDNPGWTDEGNNVISTRLTEEILLQPGESTSVEVILTWINDKDNLGLKTNIAEISEDYNEPGVPDRDSTPDNEEPGEDDIDDAPVILSIKTGQARIYFTLGFVILITIAGGIVLIKRYVL